MEVTAPENIYNSTDNDSKISHKLKEGTNDTCIFDLANNVNNIHTEDDSPSSPCASTEADQIDSV